MLIKCADEAKEIIAEFRANGISHEPSRGLDKVLRFQDLVGRSNPDGIFEFYNGLDKPTRLTFLWASCACLGPEMAESVVKYTTVRFLRRQEIDNLENEYQELASKEAIFHESKKAIHQRLKLQKNRITELERRNEWLQSRLSDQIDVNSRLALGAKHNQESADKYRQIRELLS